MTTRITDASAQGVQWHKSTYSGADSNCVECGRFTTSTAVRDSKVASGPALLFRATAWSAFIQDIKS